MVDLSKIDEIDDEAQLNKMLSEATEFDERRVIRKRLLAVKDVKSKERAKEIEEREKRREKDIEDRKNRKEEEKKQEIQRLEELAKTSTADRIENDASKKRQEYIKDKAKAADEEKKKNLEHFEEMAKGKQNSDEEKTDDCKSTSDSNKAKNIPSGAASSKTSSMNSARPKNSPASAFALFQNKDKEAGGSGKATSVPTASAANNNSNNPQSIKDNLLKWCQIKTEGYPNVNIQNFSSSWADGMAFCALIHSQCPETFDFKLLNPKNRKGNFTLAFKVAEDKCDISPLLDVEDMILMGNKPDWKCVFTYVQSIYRKLELEPKARAALEAKKNEN